MKPGHRFAWLSMMQVGSVLGLLPEHNLSSHLPGPFSLALKNAGQPNGAADGSLLTDPAEVQRPDNNGLQTIVALLQPLPARFGVSAGDILHVRF